MKTIKVPLLDESKNLTGTKTNIISIEQEGLDVLIVEDIPDDLLDKIAPIIWAKVEKKEIKDVKRVTPKKKEDDAKPDSEKGK